MPTHFYSIIPNVSELPDGLWESSISDESVNFDKDRCFALLANLEQYKVELQNIPSVFAGDGIFYWNNPAMNASDASIYYEMIRYFKPHRCLEIGSGYSTLLAAKATLKNGEGHIFEAIEPYPFDFLKKGLAGLSRLTESKLQDVSLDYFDSLQEGDILFVDSSHVVKTGSDVNYIILKIMPRLKKGVLIHFHDICLPDEMPKNWVKEKMIFWNEEYLLQALLEGGKKYETLLPVHYIGRIAEEKIRAVTGHEMPRYGGGSYWIRKCE